MNLAIQNWSEQFDEHVTNQDIDLGTKKFIDWRKIAESYVMLGFHDNPSVIELAPGNDTSYHLAITPINLFAFNQFTHNDYKTVFSGCQSGSYLINLINFRSAYTFAPGFSHPNYVGEKLGLNIADSMIIAAFLNALWYEIESLVSLN